MVNKMDGQLPHTNYFIKPTDIMDFRCQTANSISISASICNIITFTGKAEQKTVLVCFVQELGLTNKKENV